MSDVPTTPAEVAESLARENRRLQSLVAELLKKNERLRQQLVLVQQPADNEPQPAVYS